jgi:16S rRNA (cytidine1402-2'-O)-methyltransferase
MQAARPPAIAMPGTLYVVSTPIGNLEDVTLRALRVLREVDLICAEDTRVTRKLLSRYDIRTPLTSYHRHSATEKEAEVVARLASGASVALVSDAGTPGVSDPGDRLVAATIAAGVAVVPVPGPSAALTALVVSGLGTGRFAFDGFPPRNRSDRRAFFEALRPERRTIVLYEAPTRIRQTLEDLVAVLGNRRVAVGRELTKAFEEVYRGTLHAALERFGTGPARGEFTIVVEGANESPASPVPPDDAAIREALQLALDGGASVRDATDAVSARLDLPRRMVYRVCLSLRRGA